MPTYTAWDLVGAAERGILPLVKICTGCSQCVSHQRGDGGMEGGEKREWNSCSQHVNRLNGSSSPPGVRGLSHHDFTASALVVMDTLCGTKTSQYTQASEWTPCTLLLLRVLLWSFALAYKYYKKCFIFLFKCFQARLDGYIINAWVILFLRKILFDSECHRESFSQCVHSLWALWTLRRWAHFP